MARNPQIGSNPHNPLVLEAQRRLVIPDYNAFHRIPLALIDLERVAPVVLDLGCGPGTMTERVLERWPRAHVTLVDYNREMLEVSRKRFESHDDFSYICDDFMLANLGWMRCDLVVTSLTLHHQVSAEKRALFARVFDTLRPGGYFVLCDLVCASTPETEARQIRAWCNYVRGAYTSAQDAEKLLNSTRFDKPDTVEAQMGWLRDTGFIDVENPYRMLRFASIIARKPLRRA